MTPSVLASLVGAGALAGFIDAIAGGGGLITLPTLALIVGPGAHAIGTNKIVGGLAALVALLVYARGGHLDWRRSLAFTLWIALGSFAGSQVSPHIPVALFKWFLVATCPIILWIVWRKDLWVAREAAALPATAFAVAISGLVCGFYDGVWGPGGGTFMFLSLLFVAKLPLFTALAATKLANTASAFTALGGYALGGYVHPMEGLVMGTAISLGAFFGARHATRNAARIVRPVLLVVATLLLGRLLFS